MADDFRASRFDNARQQAREIARQAKKAKRGKGKSQAKGFGGEAPATSRKQARQSISDIQIDRLQELAEQSAAPEIKGGPLATPLLETDLAVRELGQADALYLDQLIQETLEERRNPRNLFDADEVLQKAYRDAPGYLNDQYNRVEALGIPKEMASGFDGLLDAPGTFTVPMELRAETSDGATLRYGTEYVKDSDGKFVIDERTGQKIIAPSVDPNSVSKTQPLTLFEGTRDQAKNLFDGRKDVNFGSNPLQIEQPTEYVQRQGIKRASGLPTFMKNDGNNKTETDFYYQRPDGTNVNIDGQIVRDGAYKRSQAFTWVEPVLGPDDPKLSPREAADEVKRRIFDYIDRHPTESLEEVMDGASSINVPREYRIKGRHTGQKPIPGKLYSKGIFGDEGVFPKDKIFYSEYANDIVNSPLFSESTKAPQRFSLQDVDLGRAKVEALSGEDLKNRLMIDPNDSRNPRYPSRTRIDITPDTDPNNVLDTIRPGQVDDDVLLQRQPSLVQFTDYDQFKADDTQIGNTKLPDNASVPGYERITDSPSMGESQLGTRTPRPTRRVAGEIIESSPRFNASFVMGDTDDMIKAVRSNVKGEAIGAVIGAVTDKDTMSALGRGDYKEAGTRMAGDALTGAVVGGATQAATKAIAPMAAKVAGTTLSGMAGAAVAPAAAAYTLAQIPDAMISFRGGQQGRTFEEQKAVERAENVNTYREMMGGAAEGYKAPASVATPAPYRSRADALADKERRERGRAKDRRRGTAFN